MTTTPILVITEVASNQNQKETTINNMVIALEDAGNNALAITFTANARTLSSAEFTRYAVFRGSNQSAAATLTVPATKRLFIVSNGNATYAINVTGTAMATVSVPVSSSLLLFCDGTELRTLSSSVGSYASLPSEVQDSPIAIPFAGAPASGAVVHIPLVHALTLPADFAGTVGYAGTVATSSAAFAIAYIRAGSPTSIGTVTFGIGASGATLSTQAAVSLLTSDILRITAPSPADATLANVAFTLMLKKV